MNEPQNSGESRRTRSPGSFLLQLVLILLFVAGFVWLLTPQVNGPRGPVPRFKCLNNIKNIGLALNNYHSKHGSYPPAFIADEHGRPVHSWRVLMLPYLDQAALYREYDFSEPWDGPNNSRLHDRILEIFRCPDDSDAPRQDTNYVVVTGPGTLFPDGESTNWDDITDNRHETILLVELAGSGIHWMEPRDLHVDETKASFNAQAGNGISSRHPGSINVVFADGHAESMSNDLDSETIKAMLTIAGGEEIEVP